MSLLDGDKDKQYSAPLSEEKEIKTVTPNKILTRLSILLAEKKLDIIQTNLKRNQINIISFESPQ